MPMYKGSIRLGQGVADSLETALTVDGGRLVVTAGEHQIGDWAVDELSVERHDGEFRVRVEGEELVVSVADPVGFSEGLGLKDRGSKRGRAKRPKAGKRFARKTRSQAETESPPPTPVSIAATPRPESSPVAVADEQPVADEPSLWSRLPLRWKLAGGGVIALSILGLFAPALLALLLLLVGMVTLFLGIAARNDSGTTVLPPPFFATTAASVGGIVLVLLAVTIIALT